MRFQGWGRITAGQETLDFGISDLEVVDGPAGPVLVSVSGPEGGLASFSLQAGGLPRPQDQVFFVGNQVTGTGHDLTVSHHGDTVELMVTGLQTGGLTCYELNSGGGFGAAFAMQGASLGVAPAMAAMTQGGQVVLADPEQPGFWVYGTGQENSLTDGVHVADSDQTHADAVGAVAALRVDGADIVVVASTSEHGVTAYALEGASPAAGGSVGPEDGLGIMVPTDIAVAEMAQGSYFIVASAAAQGASGALSVMAVDALGGLTPTDHVLDTRESRFGDATHVEALTHDGHTYVVAAGGDGGVTLLELMPGGRLVHLDSIAGSPDAGLDDVTALEIAVIGGVLQVFVTVEGEAGIFMLGVDLAGRGAALAAGDGGETLTGTAGDDIVMDGAGSDTLEGGAGADRYVLTGDGQADTIAGFDPDEDVLDLSGLPFLYDPGALNIVATDTGAVITHRDETVVLLSATGGPLDVDAVRAAVELRINHALPPPAPRPPEDEEDEHTGTEGADLIEGMDGADTLVGLGGDDTLTGLWGDDLLLGGVGDDDINAGRGDDTVEGGDGDDSIYGAGGHDSLSGGAGHDLIYGQGEDDTVEGDEGNDTLAGDLGNDLLDGGVGNDDVRGGDGNDTLLGGGGADTLVGEWGDDLLDGGAGDDGLNAGRGDDTVHGGTGDDSIFGAGGADLLVGEDGDDLIYGQGENDTADGGAGSDTLYGDLGDDVLTGGAGDDFIFGGDDNDLLDGQDHNDRLFGDGGNDTLDGGSGDDWLEGGTGNDRLDGGAGTDTVLGGAGDDVLVAGGGKDWLSGGAGQDTLTGGDGRDTFVFLSGDGVDHYTHFDTAIDRILIDPDWLIPGARFSDYVKAYIRLTDDGAIIDFGNGDVIVIDDLTLSGNAASAFGVFW